MDTSEVRRKKNILAPTSEDLNITDPPTRRKEVIKAITSLKHPKSAGQDVLKAALFKINPEFAADTLLTLFVGAWKKEEMG